MARPAKVWYRSERNCWFVTVNGQKVNLHVTGRNNEALAWAEYNRLLNGSPPDPAPTVVPMAPQPVPQPPVVRQPVTVSDVVGAFLKRAKGRVQPETYEVYRLFLNNFAVRYGDRSADTVTCELVEDYSFDPERADPTKPKWSDSTRSAFMAVLIRAFRYGVKVRLIEQNPISDLKRPPIASRAGDVLVTKEQHQKLCALSPAPFRTFLQFLWLTGCRPSECSRLTANDIDPESSTASLKHHKTATKIGGKRVIHLPPDALTLLAPLIAQYSTGPLFRNRIGNAWTRATLGMAMRKVRKLACLPNAVLYGWRHSFATDALAAGVPDALVALILGHCSTQMIHAHYNHVGDRARVLNDAVRKIR
jgi:integrase